MSFLSFRSSSKSQRSTNTPPPPPSYEENEDEFLQNSYARTNSPYSNDNSPYGNIDNRYNNSNNIGNSYRNSNDNPYNSHSSYNKNNNNNSSRSSSNMSNLNDTPRYNSFNSHTNNNSNNNNDNMDSHNSIDDREQPYPSSSTPDIPPAAEPPSELDDLLASVKDAQQESLESTRRAVRRVIETEELAISNLERAGEQTGKIINYLLRTLFFVYYLPYLYFTVFI